MDMLFLAWQITALASSLLAGGGMCYFFYKYPRARVHPGPVLMCILVSLTLANAARVGLLTVHGPHSRASGSSSSDSDLKPGTMSDIANQELSGDIGPIRPYVPFFFWSTFFFNTAATMWFLMLALDLIFSLSNPFLPFNADNVKHHIYAWPASLLWCAIFRYVFENAAGNHSRHVLLYYNLPSYVVLLYITGALMTAWRRSRRLETHAHETTRMMAKLILPYLALFALDTAVTFVLYLSEVAAGEQTATSSALDQLTFVLELLGVFALFCRDAGVFRAMQQGQRSYNPRASVFNAATTRPTTHQPHGRAGESTGKIDVPNKLRMDVMKYMSMGIRQSIRPVQEDPESQTMSQSEPAGEIEFDDYNQTKSFGVLVFGQGNHTSTLRFRDCAPKVFHSIRDHFKIDSKFYHESFDPANILSEHGSEGLSGNLFYFTCKAGARGSSCIQHAKVLTSSLYVQPTTSSWSRVCQRRSSTRSARSCTCDSVMVDLSMDRD